MSFPLFRLGLTKAGVHRIRALLNDVSWLLEERLKTSNPTDDSPKTRSKLSRIRCRVLDILTILDWDAAQEEINEDKKLIALILVKVKRRNEEKRLANWNRMIELRNK